LASEPVLTVHLVPPSLTAIAAVLNRRLPIAEAFSRLSEDLGAWIHFSAPQLAKIRYNFTTLKGGIALGVTETQANGKQFRLLWIAEQRCHSMCAILDGHCSQPWNLEKITPKMYEKHVAILEGLPKPARL
jgi:hypothetical protein